MFRNLISTCIVLLIIFQLASGQDGQPREFRTFDEWALGYEPQENPDRHIGYLRDSVRRALERSAADGTVISAFEVVAKIRNQRQEGEVIRELVYETQQNIRNIVAESGCEVTTDSDYLSLTGSVRNIFYASVVCNERDRYNELVENHGFWSNVLFMRAMDFLSTGIKDVLNLNPDFNPSIDWEAIPIPYVPDPPISPCPDYTTTPWRNWYGDAMHGGKIDCQLLTDDCEYNKGKGGRLIMIDTGISNHPELTPLVAAGKITQRHFFSSAELMVTNPYLDVMGHGTTLASLAVGKYLGIVKQATLESIKVTMDDTYKVSINAVVAAINKIIQEQTTKGKNRITPTVIFGGMTFSWTEKELCYIAYVNNPSEAMSVAHAGRLMQENKEERAPGPASPAMIIPLTPLPWSVDPPKSYSGSFSYYNTYDCAYTVVNAIKNVISYGIPYLVPTGNGVMYYDLTTFDGYATGFDRCFATRWLNSVPDCMRADEYTYDPLFMISGYRSSSTNAANAGSINRAITIGGYGKDFKNARWLNVYVVDNSTEDNFYNMGGSNYGSQWNLYNEGERCVDYAAPAADFENMPLVSGIAYGSWDYPGFDNGIDFGFYGIPQAPISGTSYAVPLAAGSILETLIRYWGSLRPTSYFPDYTFGERMVNAVDANNVIMNAGSGPIKITYDQCYVDMYDFFSFWVSEPTPVPYFTCAWKYGNYYVNDAFPANVADVNVPHNRNLFMPKYKSTEKQCNMIPTPGGNNPPVSRDI